MIAPFEPSNGGAYPVKRRYTAITGDQKRRSDLAAITRNLHALRRHRGFNRFLITSPLLARMIPLAEADLAELRASIEAERLDDRQIAYLAYESNVELNHAHSRAK